MIVGVIVLLGLALVVLASPRHRSFYLRMRAPSSELSPRAIVRAVRGAATTGAIVSRRRVVTPDVTGLRVPISDDLPARLPADGVPAGWELHEFTGRGDVELVQGDQGPAIHLRSSRTSFAVHRDLVVSLEEFPILGWSWNVVALPAEGDVRDRRRDDQAAQVYVVFPRWPSPRTQSDVIGYVWDTTAPVGTTLTSPNAPNVRIIVVESGPARLGAWQRQRRNVATDYEALFHRRAPRVGTIALMIDSNDTGGTAEATFGDLMFVRAPSKE